MNCGIFAYRRRLCRSRTCLCCLPFLILCCLCSMAFLVLDTFKESLGDPALDFQVFINDPVNRASQLQFGRKRSERPGTPAGKKKEPLSKNRIILPDDCFDGLLRVVDPTCDLGMFCTADWRQEDVLCHVVLRQMALVPGHAQCRVTLNSQDETDENADKMKESERDNGLKPVNGDSRNGQGVNRDQEQILRSADKNEDKADAIIAEEANVKNGNSVHLFNHTEPNIFNRLWKNRDNPDRRHLVREASNVKGKVEELAEVNAGKAKEKDGAEDRNVVPRIAYYVLMSETCLEPYSFLFLHYLSVLSVRRFLRPRAIYVLGNCVPVGYWWSRVVNDVQGVRFVHRPRPLITKDGKVNWISHLADVIRLQVLLVNGGVYVDTDMVLLRPLDPLLRHPLTMGLVDNRTGMGNALILAARGSRFLAQWYDGYRDFRPDHFHHNGMWGALRLWQADPDGVHMESRRFYSPNWYEAHLLFNDTSYDLADSYAVHIWHRHSAVPTSPQGFIALNTTLGKVFRRVYFGV